jgi:hypothetical protein
MKEKMTAFLEKKDGEWIITLNAETPKKERTLGKMIEENTSRHRKSGTVLILWEREAKQSADGGVTEISFVISEGPDSYEYDNAKAGLKILNLKGLFKEEL